MKKKTKTSKKSLTARIRGDKVFHVGTRDGVLMASVPYTQEDFKNSLLIVSVVINLFFLITWLTTQVNAEYAVAIAKIITN